MHQALRPRLAGVSNLAIESSYRAEIDGLRGLAVLAVVAYHAFPNRLPGGFVGVDVFFVISGFLISRIIVAENAAGRFDLRQFYARRVLRIFPALVVVLSACMTAGFALLTAEEFAALGKHVAAAATFTSNILLWSEDGYFELPSEMKPLLHLWSLGIEEQFYLVLPVMLLATLSRSMHMTWVALCYVGGASLLLSVWLTIEDSNAAFFLLHTRFWELLAGALLAVATYAMQPPRRVVADVMSASGLCLLAFCLCIHREWGFPGLLAVLPVLGAVLTIAAGRAAWLGRVVLSQPLLVGAGLISYPLYLWHWPLLSFANLLTGGAPSRELIILLIIISVALAWGTYQLVERPLRGSRRTVKKVVILVAGMAMLGIFGLCAFAAGGFSFSPGAQRKIENAGDIGSVRFLEYSTMHFFPCTPAHLHVQADRFDRYVRCFQSRKSEPVTLAIVGDSHAEHLFIGLAEAIPDRNIAYYTRGAPPGSATPT